MTVPASDFVTLDSGEREDFSTGARRDTSDGKPRYDLISPKQERRQAELMARGAEKYGERNWELGMPLSRYYESARRHLAYYIEGDRLEDHLAAVLFNIGAMIHFEGTEHDDINPVTPTSYKKSSAYFFEPPATYENAHGKLEYTDVNTRAAQLTLPGFPSPEDAGAPPKV